MNGRKSHRYFLDGQGFNSVQEVADFYSIPYGTIYTRLTRGKTLAEAVETPLCSSAVSDSEIAGLTVKQPGRSGVRFDVEVGGKHYPSLKQASKAHGLKYHTVKKRLLSQWSLEEAFGIIPREPTSAKRLKEEEWLLAEELGVRFCKGCKTSKPLDSFPIHGSCIGGRSPTCRVCKTNAIREKRYSITTDEYEAMLEQQGHVCAICSSGNPETRKGHSDDMKWQWCVDHDHTTGKVRGLLCMSCNVGLGKFRDDIEVMSKAIDYLKANNIEEDA